MTKNKENLVLGGFFGCLIGGLFMAFGEMSNILCEMLFWSFVLYVVMIYFEIIPNVVKNMIKKYNYLSQYMIFMAWVPLVVGCFMVIFLASLLFIDYSIAELKMMLMWSKGLLFIMMMMSVGVVYIKRHVVSQLRFGF